MAKPEDKGDKERHTQTGHESKRKQKQRRRKLEILTSVASQVLLFLCAAVALGIAFYYLSVDKHVTAAWWGLGAWFGAGIAIFLYVYPIAHSADADPDDDPIAAVKSLLEAQTAQQLRPYVGVTYVKGTFDIGQPIAIVIKFTNTGKSPAQAAEAFMEFTKIRTGTRIRRDYTAKDFENATMGEINGGNTVEISRSGHEWTLTELMQVTTDRSHKIVVHGVIRYRSKHIPSGGDEARFCYEFDPESGGMIACRRDTLPENEGQQ